MKFALRTCLIYQGSSVQLLYSWPHQTNLFPRIPMFSPTSLFRGDVDSATEVLEEVFTSPDSTSPSMSFVFRKIFEENNDNAIDKCKKLTRRSNRCLREKANPASKLNVDAAVLQWAPWRSDWPTISPATDQPQTSSCCSWIWTKWRMPSLCWLWVWVCVYTLSVSLEIHSIYIYLQLWSINPHGLKN